MKWYNIFLVKDNKEEKIARCKSKGIAYRIYKEIKNIYENSEYEVILK